MRYILIILGLLLFVSWTVPSLKWGMEVVEAEEAMREGDFSRLPEVLGGPAPVRWWQDRKEFNDTVNTSYLSDRRTIGIEVEMPIEALFAEGEPLPKPAYLEAYAYARTPARLMAHCREVLNTIGVACDVSKPRARVTKDGRAHLRGSLRFVPVDPPGDLNQEGKRPIHLRAVLTRGVEVPFTAEGRQKALTNARFLCNSLRSVTGNCVVTRVTLAAKRMASDRDAPLLDARAQMTVHTDPARINKKALEDTLAKLTAVLMY